MNAGRGGTKVASSEIFPHKGKVKRYFIMAEGKEEGRRKEKNGKRECVQGERGGPVRDMPLVCGAVDECREKL